MYENGIKITIEAIFYIVTKVQFLYSYYYLLHIGFIFQGVQLDPNATT